MQTGKPRVTIRYAGRAALLGLAALTLTLCSCGGDSGPPTYPVSGTVKFDGKPLADGSIKFADTAEGYFVEIPIKDGKFSGQAKAGDLRVEIYSYKEGPPAAPMPGMEPEPTRENIIPDKHNVNSTMTKEVKAEGENKFEFDLDK